METRSNHTGQDSSLRHLTDRISPNFSPTSEPPPQPVVLPLPEVQLQQRQKRRKVRPILYNAFSVLPASTILTRYFHFIEPKKEEEEEGDVDMGDLFGGDDDY